MLAFAPTDRRLRAACAAVLVATLAACTRSGADVPETVVQFAGAKTVVQEGAPAVAVRVELRTSKAALTRAVEVDVVDLGTGTAEAGADFEPLPESHLIFPAGSVDGALATVVLGALDDTRAEGANETVRFALTHVRGPAELGQRKRHTVEIEDADFVTVEFENAASSTRDEHAQTFPIALVLALAAGVTMDADFSVRITDAGTGTATRGADYAPFVPQALTLPRGALGGTIFPIGVAIEQDLAAEGAETVVLALDLPSAGAQLGLRTTHTLTITDDDLGAGATIEVVSNPQTSATPLASGALVDLGSQILGGGATGGRRIRATNGGAGSLTLELPLLGGAQERDFALEFVVDGAWAAGFTAEDALPSPLVATAGAAGPGRGRALEPELLATLDARERVRLIGFPLRDESVALDLVRVRTPWSADARLVIDGVNQPARARAAPPTCWHGRIVDEPGSDVFLALSVRGVQGWVRRGGEAPSTLHLVGRRAHDVRELDDADLAQLGARAPLDFCSDAPTPVGFTAPRGSAPENAGPTPGSEPTCRMALESDYQLYQLFGNANELSDYVTALVAASSIRYRIDVGTALEIAYLGVHTQSNDGWSTPDFAGTASQMLDEFQQAWGQNWGGTWPVQANLAHFLSGASLGGGVAYIGTLCDRNWGFAVSGNLNGAIPWSNWSGAAGPLNWDFLVFAHETGHNFGAQHTHAYCPPLDRCYSSCAQGVQCQQGTLMSYCHICGGLSAVDLRFHAFVANQMRSNVRTSCLGDFVLAPGAMLDWFLRFDPQTGLGVRQATLEFEHNAYNAPSSFTLALTGNATP